MLTRYHSAFPRKAGRSADNNHYPVLLTVNNSVSLTNLEYLISILDFRFATPGGFSICLADPAHTRPGLAGGYADLLVPIFALIVRDYATIRFDRQR